MCVVCVYCVLLSSLVFASCVCACLFYGVCDLWDFKCDDVGFVFECFFILRAEVCLCVRLRAMSCVMLYGVLFVCLCVFRCIKGLCALCGFDCVRLLGLIVLCRFVCMCASNACVRLVCDVLCDVVWFACCV